MARDFEILKPYKGFKLYKVEDGGVAFSLGDTWLGCVFDSEETAHHFINLRKKFVTNVFDVIEQSQKTALSSTTNGLVTKDIINTFKLKP